MGMSFRNIIFILPFETYGRYVEILNGSTILELLRRNRGKIMDCIRVAKAYSNLMYMFSKTFHTLFLQYYRNQIKG